MDDWFSYVGASIEDIHAMQSRFLQIHADSCAVYGLFWQDYQISSVRKGWKFNVKNSCANKIISTKKLQEDPYLDLTDAVEDEQEKEWKRLISEGKIPGPIPKDLITAGSRNVQPLMEDYCKWRKMYKEYKKQDIKYTPLQYKNSYMNVPSSAQSSNSNPENLIRLSESRSTILPPQRLSQQLTTTSSPVTTMDDKENGEEKQFEFLRKGTDDGEQKESKTNELQQNLKDIDGDVNMVSEQPSEIVDDDNDHDDDDDEGDDNDDDATDKQSKEKVTQEKDIDANQTDDPLSLGGIIDDDEDLIKFLEENPDY